MPLNLRRGHVTAVIERVPGLARIEVDGVACVAYPDVTGPVAVGDDVVVNTDARRLGLGSGGFDVVYLNLTRGLALEGATGAHVMNFPYTPLQHAVVYAEEAGTLADTLGGMPVVCCTLHSQVVPACAAIAPRRVAYVQLAGGALPVALSDALRALRERELVEQVIAVSPCFGGDAQCVNVYSALALARAEECDVVVCAIGPGVVGTGSRLGHGGMSAAEAANAASALGGSPVVAVRVSEADARPRHRGVSHHSATVLDVAPNALVGWPLGCPVEHPFGERARDVDVSGWRDACSGLPLSHMGRGAGEEEWFFAAAFAAGRLARELA